MTESQHRFFDLLEQAAWLLPYWDRQEQACRIDRLTAAMGSWSEGEQHLARFFAMVWFGKNRLGFELVDAVAVLDNPSRMIIVHWVKEPFWP